jgi:hypothetical protein
VAVPLGTFLNLVRDEQDGGINTVQLCDTLAGLEADTSHTGYGHTTREDYAWRRAGPGATPTDLDGITGPRIPADLSNVLERVRLRQSDDAAKLDLELLCELCGKHICDAQDDDTIGVLARCALGHMAVCAQWEEHSLDPRPAARH